MTQKSGSVPGAVGERPDRQQTILEIRQMVADMAVTLDAPNPKLALGTAIEAVDAWLQVLARAGGAVGEREEPHDALRTALEDVLREFDYWASDPRPAVDGGTVRIYKFREVQPAMERKLEAARSILARLSVNEGGPTNE